MKLIWPYLRFPKVRSVENIRLCDRQKTSKRVEMISIRRHWWLCVTKLADLDGGCCQLWGGTAARWSSGRGCWLRRGSSFYHFVRAAAVFCFEVRALHVLRMFHFEAVPGRVPFAKRLFRLGVLLSRLFSSQLIQLTYRTWNLCDQVALQSLSLSLDLVLHVGCAGGAGVASTRLGDVGRTFSPKSNQIMSLTVT